MSETRHARPAALRAGPGRAAPAWIVLSLGLLLPACDGPTQPATSGSTGAGESGARLSRLAALGPALGEEADRLLPSLGDGFSEQRLRLALRALRERVSADQTGELSQALDETQGLVRSYQPDDGSVDPTELDAIQLLMTSVDELMSADRAEAQGVERPPGIKSVRRPS